MPTLHTVNKSPFERNSLETCLSTCKSDASILLIEDAVVAALIQTDVSSKLEAVIDKGVKVFALGEDLKARGFSNQRILDRIAVVDYAGFVNLSVENDRVQAWL